MTTTVKMLPPPATNKACFNNGSSAIQNADGTFDVPIDHIGPMMSAGFTLAIEPASKLAVSADATALTLNHLPAGYNTAGLGWLQGTLQDGTKVAIPYFAHS